MGMKVEQYVHFVGYNKNSKVPTLSLNSDNNKYHCVRCGTGGYGTELYAKVRGISKCQAIDELLKKECYSQNKVKIEISPINLLANIKLRNAVYRDFLNMLKLEGQHISYLRRIGLLDSSIEDNLYRTAPKNYIKRRIIAHNLSKKYDLARYSWIFPRG